MTLKLIYMALEIDGMTYIIMCIKSYVNNLLVGYEELRSGSEQVAVGCHL